MVDVVDEQYIWLIWASAFLTPWVGIYEHITWRE